MCEVHRVTELAENLLAMLCRAERDQLGDISAEFSEKFICIRLQAFLYEQLPGQFLSSIHH